MISFTTATSTMIITVSDSPEGKLGEAQFAFFLDFYYFGFDSYCGYHKICASLQCTERHLLLHPLLLSSSVSISVSVCLCVQKFKKMDTD